MTAKKSQELNLNSEGKSIGQREYVTTSRQVNGWNVFSIEPNNISTKVTLNNNPPMTIPKGSSYPFLAAGEYYGSSVTVTNRGTNVATETKISWFGIPTKVEDTLKPNPVKVAQYGSASGKSTTSVQYLDIKANSDTEATLALLMVGGGKPQAIFLNTSADGVNIPKDWLDNLTKILGSENIIQEPGQNYQIRQNYGGNTVFIANLSRTKTASFEASLG